MALGHQRRNALAEAALDHGLRGRALSVAAAGVPLLKKTAVADESERAFVDAITLQNISHDESARS